MISYKFQTPNNPKRTLYLSMETCTRTFTPQISTGRVFSYWQNSFYVWVIHDDWWDWKFLINVNRWASSGVNQDCVLCGLNLKIEQDIMDKYSEFLHSIVVELNQTKPSKANAKEN